MPYKKSLTPKQIAYAKLLRRQIMATVAKNGWDKDEFYGFLADWKYGNSLRKLTIEQLICVKHMCEKSRGRSEYPEREIERSDASQYDEQAMYIHSLSKQAGWTADRMRKYLLVHFKKTHLNVLEPPERRGMILMFNKYIKAKANDN